MAAVDDPAAPAATPLEGGRGAGGGWSLALHCTLARASKPACPTCRVCMMHAAGLALPAGPAADAAMPGT